MSPHTRHKRRGNSSLFESCWSAFDGYFSSPSGVVELQNWRSGDDGDALFVGKFLKSKSSCNDNRRCKLLFSIWWENNESQTYRICRCIAEYKWLRIIAECSTRWCRTTTWCRVNFLFYVLWGILCFGHHRNLKKRNFEWNANEMTTLSVSNKSSKFYWDRFARNEQTAKNLIHKNTNWSSLHYISTIWLWCCSTASFKSIRLKCVVPKNNTHQPKRKSYAHAV